jgi:excisionase family DNA binding protein
MSDRLASAVAELVDALREELAADARATGPGQPDRLLSINDACAQLSIKRSALYGELGAGRLRSVKVGRRRLVPSGAVAAYIAERGA